MRERKRKGGRNVQRDQYLAVVKSTENVKIVRLKIKSYMLASTDDAADVCACVHTPTWIRFSLVGLSFVCFSCCYCCCCRCRCLGFIFSISFSASSSSSYTEHSHSHTHSIRFELFFLVVLVCLGVSERVSVCVCAYMFICVSYLYIYAWVIEASYRMWCVGRPINNMAALGLVSINAYNKYRVRQSEWVSVFIDTTSLVRILFE